MNTRSWSSPRDWSLRVKLAVVLLVPGILAVILGVLRIADQTGQAAELDRVARFATAQGDVTGLVERVSEERYRSTTFVAGARSGDPDGLRAGFAEVDATRTAIGPTLQTLYADDAALAGSVSRADQAIARLADVRALTLTSSAPAAAVVARYSGIVDQLAELDGTLLRGVNTTEVNGLATALAGLSAARNEVSLQYALVTAAGAGGDVSADLAASDARLRSTLAAFRAPLDPGQRVRYGTLIAGPLNTARAALVQELLVDGAAADTAPAVFEGVLAEVDATEEGVRGELVTTSAERRTAAVNLAAVNTTLLVLALLAGTLLIGLIARAMITSLRTLRLSAMEVAEQRLPDAIRAMREGNVPDVDVPPVPVTTREEVGEVARAFDAVHSQAVRLAAEQATLQHNVNRMFVNLSRRSQTLVDRQLQLIEELEKGEQDPDQLASLFRLDHLATRMRRNSENLLVLAGTDLAKRSAQHVPTIDVLQAAVSEVERYERVIVEQPPAASVVGRAASDLQHLLSELLDNALDFSPPESQVRMSTTRLTSGPLVVEVSDSGVGMPAADLESANQQLSMRNAVTVDASRQMGLFVVGRLAARHGIDVRLVTGAGLIPARVQRGGIPVSITDNVGLTARVTIPAHLVVNADRWAPERPAPSRPDGGRPEPGRTDGGPAGPRPPTFPARPAPVPQAGWWNERPDGAPTGDAPQPADSRPLDFRPLDPLPLDSRPSGSWSGTPAATPRPAEAQTEGPAAHVPNDAPTYEEAPSNWFRSYREVPINWQDSPPVPVEGAVPAPREDRDTPGTDDTGPDGLPRRTPGAQLRPGSAPVAGAQSAPRDPDAVRGRLTSYQRGAGGPPDEPGAAATGGDRTER